jgi:hypothetical protein
MGEACEASYYSLGGTLTITSFDPTEERALPGDEPNPEEVRRWLREKTIETIHRYEQSGRFSDKELFTIYRIWLDGWSLRRVALVEGVKPQAIRERIEGNKHGHGGLSTKAFEFYDWWSCKNRGRRKK